MIPVGQNTFVEGYYDSDKCPADWKASDRHSWACRPGRLNEENSKRILCPCCMNEITKVQIPYGEDVKELSYLGSGFPLFYNYLKFCILMLAALLADSCILSGYLSSQQNECTSGTNPNCVPGVANSLSYISSELTPAVRIIGDIVSFLVQLALLLLMRQVQNSLTIYYDERTHKISDFTLKVKNIPGGFDNNKSKLQQLIKLRCPEVTIEGTLLVRRSDLFDEKVKQLRKLNHEKSLTEQDDSIKTKILNAHYDQAAVEIAETVKLIELDQITFFTGIAFVTTSTKPERDKVIAAINQLTDEEILSIYPSTKLQIRKKVRAIIAREPAEIIWENIDKPKQERTLALFGGWILTIVFLTVLTIAFFFMISARSHFIEVSVTSGVLSDYILGIFMGYFTITMIVILNKFLLPPVCHILTDLEKHTNCNEFEFSFALKYTLSMFFTTALMTLAVEAIVFKNYYSSKFGVVQAESYVFILNAGIPPIVWAINPYYLIARYKQNKKYGSEELTQQQANSLMELPQYSIGKRYADTVKTMWFTFLYVSIIPLGAVFSMIGVILYFFVDKFVLLRRSSVKHSVSSHLANYMMFLLDLTLIFKPLGELFFDFNLRKETRISTYVMLGAGILYMLLPLNRILNALFPEKALKHVYTYDELKETFVLTYSNSYPMNRQKRTVMMDTILRSSSKQTSSTQS